MIFSYSSFGTTRTKDIMPITLALQFGGIIRKAAPAMTALVCILILIGGFVVKYVIIAAGQAT